MHAEPPRTFHPTKSLLGPPVKVRAMATPAASGPDTDMMLVASEKSTAAASTMI
jgi:hypothetical protein